MNKKLTNILREANNNSVYYNKLFSACGFDYNDFNLNRFKQIQPLSRKCINDNFENILSKEYHYINRKNLIVQRTSGSTGHFVETYWQFNEFSASNLCLWRKRYKWYGITASDRMCTFVANELETEKIIIKNNIMEFSSIYLSECDLQAYLSSIHSFMPKWLMLSPSIALLILEFCKKETLTFPESVKYIELFGENVTLAAKDAISSYFNIPVSIMYGAKEVNGIGLTCPNGHMHVLEDNNYIEVDDRGHVLITNLHNTCFPIIRYDIGDIIELDSTIACFCGTKGEVITKIDGKDHYLSFIDAESGITTRIVKSIVDDIDMIFDYPIIQFQIQYDQNGVILHLYIKQAYIHWETEIASAFDIRAKRYFKKPTKLVVQFHRTPLSYNKNTGKLPMIQ